ncbi:MAG: thioredoxin family protein [Chitinophagaceae bacterium]|nr:thioredoxin family protein [Chitinophagaceae bacterium]
MTLSLSLLVVFICSAQDMKKFNLYKPEENAATELDKVVQQASKEGKNVFVQIGGNWCVWCARYYEYVNKDPQLDSIMKADYVVYHLNYSKENLNKEIMAKLGYPQRFGFPVFVILDDKGNRLHTQNSAYLEQDEGYDKQRVTDFLTTWNPKALDPAQYKNF